MTDSLFRPMINLGNSIVGVSIVTMPWCFSQCGIVLGTILLLLSAMFTVWSCRMLLRTANMTRQHTYETLGLAVFGPTGKLAVELSNIGLTMGCCVAFFVIIGDLLPPIVANMFGIQWHPGTLRAVLLVLSATFVAFPLTLLRNVDKLSVISLGSLFFYLFLIFQLAYNSKGNLAGGGVWEGVAWWKTMGIIKCLPIFSLAFCCQTQMFVIYTTLQDGSVRRMTTVVYGAISLVAIGYLMVAVFGYLSYFNYEIKGDILANFPINLISQFTRFGFSFTVLLSFPLMIFPGRISINSILFHTGAMELHLQPPIPQGRFVAITSTIMASALTLAILIPNIQTVLGLIGATLGSLICFIFPGAIFIKVAGSNSDYSNKAKLCLVIGVCVLVLSTMVTLNSWTEEGTQQYHIKTSIVEPDVVVKLPPAPEPLDKLVVEQKSDNDEVKMDDLEIGQKKEKEDNLDVNQEKVNLDVPFDPGEQAAVVVHDADSAKDPPLPEVKEVEVEEGRNEVHKQLDKDLSKLAARVEQLEEENRDLKDRQEVIEKIQEHNEDPPDLDQDGGNPLVDKEKHESVDRVKPLVDKENEENPAGKNIEDQVLNHKSHELVHPAKPQAVTELSVKKDLEKKIEIDKKDIEDKKEDQKNIIVVTDEAEPRKIDGDPADRAEDLHVDPLNEQDSKKHILRDLKSYSNSAPAA